MLEDTLVELINAIKEIAPEIWDILVKQVYVDAFSYCAWFLVLLSTCYGLYKFGVYATQKAEEDSYSNWVAYTLGFVFSVFSGFGAIGFLVSAITRFMNPEFYAIRYILSSL